jgi:hypothetical protein
MVSAFGDRSGNLIHHRNNRQLQGLEGRDAVLRRKSGSDFGHRSGNLIHHRNNRQLQGLEGRDAVLRRSQIRLQGRRQLLLWKNQKNPTRRRKRKRWQ